MISKTFFAAALCAATAYATDIDEPELNPTDPAFDDQDDEDMRDLRESFEECYSELDDEEIDNLIHDYLEHEEYGSEEFDENEFDSEVDSDGNPMAVSSFENNAFAQV